VPSVFEKLNLKDNRRIVVLQAPESFEPALAELLEVEILRSLETTVDVEFFLTFVTKQYEVNRLGKLIAARAKGDAVVWFAYPKRTSKKYKSEINRDNGWDVMGAAGFEPVRAVAIDEDWSALRFRRPVFIKTMTRGKEHRMSEEGKAKK
jgi:hypothetical protein